MTILKWQQVLYQCKIFPLLHVYERFFFFYFLFLFILLLLPRPSVHLLYCIFYLHPFSVKGYKTTSKVHVSLNLHTINHLVEPVLPWHQYLDWGLENHLLWQFHYYELVQTEFLCIYVLRVATGPRVKLASCKSALNLPVVCCTDRSKAVVPVLVLLLVALWFILRSDLLYVFSCVILFLCFSVLLVLRLPRFSYICLVCACLDLSVSSSSWGLGRAAVCDCGAPWTFLLLFLYCVYM